MMASDKLAESANLLPNFASATDEWVLIQIKPWRHWIAGAFVTVIGQPQPAHVTPHPHSDASDPLLLSSEINFACWTPLKPFTS